MPRQNNVISRSEHLCKMRSNWPSLVRITVNLMELLLVATFHFVNPSVDIEVYGYLEHQNRTPKVVFLREFPSKKRGYTYLK